MSTNHTPNYALSQWEPADKVLMDDFNADNAKIDAALRDTRPYLIQSWVTEEDAGQVELDISGIQWTRYSWVIIDVLLSAKISVALSVNGSGVTHASGSGSYGYIAESPFPTCTLRMVCPVFYRDDVPLTNVTFSKSGSLGSSNLIFRELTTLTVSPYGNATAIPAKTEIKIWGMM